MTIPTTKTTKITVGNGTGSVREIKRDGVKVGTIQRITRGAIHFYAPVYIIRLDDGRTAEKPRFDWARETAIKMLEDPSFNAEG